MTTTLLVCSKCGKSQEFYAALKAGWLHAQRKDAQQGYLVIRCPDHITGHALRLAGLPQQRTSKRIEDNLDRGLWTAYGDGYIASAYGVEDDDGAPHCIVSYHVAGMPAHKIETFRTVQALIQTMRKIEPDLRKWKLQDAEG